MELDEGYDRGSIRGIFQGASCWSRKWSCLGHCHDDLLPDGLRETIDEFGVGHGVTGICIRASVFAS